MQLTDSQVQFIHLDLLKRGVYDASLQEDLVDHICCLVEDEMEKTRDFKSAYKNVLKVFGSFKTLQLVTDEEIKSVGWPTTIFRALNYVLTFVILIFCLALLALPCIIAMNCDDKVFPFLFFPTVITGCYICSARIDYKKFVLLSF